METDDSIAHFFVCVTVNLNIYDKGRDASVCFLCKESITHARLVPASLQYWHHFTSIRWMDKKWASMEENNVATRLV